MMNDKKEKPITFEDIKSIFLNEDAEHRALTPGAPPLDMAELRDKLKSGEMKIEMAPVLHIGDLQKEIDEVLDAMGFESAFVTDGSRVGDFGLEPEEIEQAAEILKIPIEKSDYLYQVAQRLKDTREE